VRGYNCHTAGHENSLEATARLAIMNPCDARGEEARGTRLCFPLEASAGGPQQQIAHRISSLDTLHRQCSESDDQPSMRIIGTCSSSRQRLRQGLSGIFSANLWTRLFLHCRRGRMTLRWGVVVRYCIEGVFNITVLLCTPARAG